MTRIQQVLWELEMDYIGHPYYVSGNAILHALGQHLDRGDDFRLSASHGMFVPSEYGSFPDEHSQSRGRPSMGGSLPTVEAYDDLFLHRDTENPWLLDSRPRDALNVQALRVHSGHPVVAHERFMGLPEEKRSDTRRTSMHVSAYLHTDDPASLPISDDALERVQFGGKRNYGYGEVSLKDTQVIDLDALDYSRLEGADAYLLELVTPYVLASEYPGTDDTPVPWWWAESRDDLRMRDERILDEREVFRLETVDHGQVVEYIGDRPVETAKSGIVRVGSHSGYGFGELRVKPITEETRKS